MLFFRYAPRHLGLDFLRALAIAMVFVGHGVTLHGLPILGELGTGVDLFFVLSGFLIGRIYFRSLRDGTFTLWSFWQARWWRTLPPYFAALALYAIAMRRIPNEPVAGSYALFIQNYCGIIGFNASWSLCVEEHFYVLFPLLGAIVGRTLGVGAFGGLLPAAFIAPTVLRAATLAATGELPAGWFWMTHLHCEGLVAGVWVAYVKVERPDRFQRLLPLARKLAPLTPGLLFVLPLWPDRDPWINVWVFTLLAVGYAAWLRIALSWQWQPGGAATRCLVRVVQAAAVSSYSIYLTHSLSFAVFRTLVDSWPRGAAKTGFILGSSLAVAWLFYLLVEQTTLVLRDRFVHRSPTSNDDLVVVSQRGWASARSG